MIVACYSSEKTNGVLLKKEIRKEEDDGEAIPYNQHSKPSFKLIDLHPHLRV